MDFWVENQVFVPKKMCSLLAGRHVLATIKQSCANKNVPFSQTTISLLLNFEHFWGKTDFRLKKHKYGRSSLIPGGTRTVVIVGRFFDGSDHGPKLRVLILAKWHKPKMAQNRVEPRKWTQSWEMQFFWGWSEWESCSPGYADDMPPWQNHNPKKLTFSP